MDGGVPQGAWRRVHPVSPVLNAWKALAALLAVIVYQNADTVSGIAESRWAREAGAGVLVALVAAGLLVFLAVAGLYSWLAWRSTSYAVTADAVWYRSGILFRRQRHARLDRVQSVDVIHPLLGRIFGLGQLSVEVAGGAGSSLVFGYLASGVLEDLRNEVLARAAGLQVGPAPTATPPGTDGAGTAAQDGTAVRAGSAVPTGTGAAGPEVSGAAVSSAGVSGPGAFGPAVSGTAPTPPATDPTAAATPGVTPGATASPSSITHAPAAPERELYTVPPGRLLASLLLSGTVVASVLAGLVIVVVGIWATVSFGVASLSAYLGFIPAVIGVGSYLWGRFAGEFNFRAAVSADGIRVRRGLTATSSQTIPPRRIHAVRVQQPWLWRRRGWYRVTVSQAGIGRGGGRGEADAARTSDVLLPVGTIDETRLALWLVVRDLGVEDPLGFLDRALTGWGGPGGESLDEFVPNPPSSRVLDPWSWRRRGVALTRTVLAVREGRLSRSVSLAPAERLQSLEVRQGPWERRRGVADLSMQIVPGSVSVRARHVDAAAVADLADRLLVLARERRAAEPPEKWMLRVSGALEDGSVREEILGDSRGEEGA